MGMQANKSQFFETSNFYLIHNIISKDLYNKFNYKLDGNSKNKLFDIMNNIYNRNNNLNLKDLNILTIRTAAPLFKQICENNSGIKNLENNNSLNRDMLIQKKMPDFVDMRPEYRNENSEDINNAYNSVNERYAVKKPAPIDFSLPNNNANDVNTNFKNIESRRENEIGNKGGETKISEIIGSEMSSDISNLQENNYEIINQDNRIDLQNKKKTGDFSEINNAMVDFEEEQKRNVR